MQSGLGPLGIQFQGYLGKRPCKSCTIVWWLSCFAFHHSPPAYLLRALVVFCGQKIPVLFARMGEKENLECAWIYVKINSFQKFIRALQKMSILFSTRSVVCDNCKLLSLPDKDNCFETSRHLGADEQRVVGVFSINEGTFLKKQEAFCWEEIAGTLQEGHTFTESCKTLPEFLRGPVLRAPLGTEDMCFA